MAHNRSRKRLALYEVIGKTRHKSSHDKTLEQLRSEKTGEDESTAARAGMPTSGMAAQWPKRPRIVQFNAGRLEISMPYQLAIALFLGLVLLILVAFRIGQNISGPKITDSAEGIPKNMQDVPQRSTAGAKQTPGADKKISPSAGKVEPAKPKGDNRIVITQYHTSRDLEPVRKYFAANGIETVIVKRGSWFFLKSKNAYENPGKAGTDGHAALKRIIKVGAGYKAPQGYESFAPNLFSDAYGEKIR